jgi:methionyl-tRNA formyltransferase
LNLVISVVLGKVADFIFKDKFYSIQKISKLYDIPLITIQKLHSQQLYDLIEQSPKKVVFAQVGQKIKADLLDKAVFWNKHCGLLPSYKGVYPIFWALLNEEPYLGVSVHVMNEEFDEGAILSQAKIANHNLTFFQAYHTLYDLAAQLLINLCLYDEKQTIDNTSCKSSYYSFPTSKDRKSFQKNHRFGFPFRLHPSLKLKP